MRLLLTIIFLSVLFASCINEDREKELLNKISELETQLDDCRNGAEKLHAKIKIAFQKNDYELCKSIYYQMEQRHPNSVLFGYVKEIHQKVVDIERKKQEKLSNAFGKESSDSLFTNRVSYKYWEVCWNDSMAIRIDSRDSRIDTIYQNVSEYDDSDTTTTMIYYYNKSNRMLSIVGPYLTYAVSYDGSGGVHPIYGTYYTTYNIVTTNEISLDEIFDPHEIYKTLLKDSTINEHLKKSNPSDLNELLDNLDGECEINFRSILNDFAFYDIVGDSVLVEFGLSHGCEILRGTFTSIQILLPIPDSRSFFSKAKENYTLKRYSK